MVRPGLMASLALLLSVAATGCTRITLADDVDLSLDFHPLIGPSDALHSPYVKGATLRIYVRSTNDKENMRRWTLETSNADVLAIVQIEHDSDDYGRLSARCHAAAEGTAVITARDEDGEVLTA